MRVHIHSQKKALRQNAHNIRDIRLLAASKYRYPHDYLFAGFIGCYYRSVFVN
jgi:hypothetical protein